MPHCLDTSRMLAARYFRANGVLTGLCICPQYDPETFSTWCNILRRVPQSVLWLLRFPPYGEPRIRAEAAARGVDPNRIIFTDVAAKPIHIRRSGIADVFLDTPLCNAHTTGEAMSAAWCCSPETPPLCAA